MTGGDPKWAVHVAAELVALMVVAPGLWWVSSQDTVTPAARWFLRVVVVGTVVVDGWLLARNLARA